VIAIVSSEARERLAFAALCEQAGGEHRACDSLRAFRRALGQTPPRIVLCRHRLADGYSDDLLRGLREAASDARVIVLLQASASAALEARQLALGADYVFRDPVRTEVLLEYLRRAVRASRAKTPRASRRRPVPLKFGAATIDPIGRTVRHEGRTRAITPRELQLLKMLLGAGSDVVTYAELYREILGRAFQGDTSNLRVLLGKLDASFRAVGINLRHHVEVIPKTGYRYHARRAGLRVAPPPAPATDAAA
jgi:DNA-binding response OmpR family regulator